MLHAYLVRKYIQVKLFHVTLINIFDLHRNVIFTMKENKSEFDLMILIRSNLATLLHPAGGLEVRALVRVRQSLRFKSGSAGLIFSPGQICVRR